MLKIYKTVRRAFDVTVISLKRYDAPLRGKCQDFRCTCCSAKLGDRGWGLAWINDGKGERSARLCFDCTEDAAAALAESQATVNQQPQVETADTKERRAKSPNKRVMPCAHWIPGGICNVFTDKWCGKDHSCIISAQA
jgi:hypothetical protein